MNKIVFCEECRNDVSYIVEEKEMIGTIRGKDYLYLGKEATCANCGSYVDVDEISEYNLKALYDVYRKENNIISLEKIREIPDKYAIGKRPLSILLGWGEHTFTRYCDGDMPTRQYSKILERLYEEPSFYLNILEENKELLPSFHAYKKSLKATNTLIDGAVKDEKMDMIVSYLLNQCEDITPLALQKTLYYVQGFYYAFYKKFLFNSDCEAWVHGPVYKDVYVKYADYHFDPISKAKNFDVSVFNAEEKVVLDSVVRNICCYSGKVLEEFTHNESPWLDTRMDLNNEQSSNRVIDKKLIGNYFLSVKQRYGMNVPKDIILYTKDIFESL